MSAVCTFHVKHQYNYFLQQKLIRAKNSKSHYMKKQL